MLTALLLLFATLAFSQDTLYLHGGKKEAVKVEQVNPTEVRYTFWNMKDSPEIVLKKSEVQKIVFRGGQVMELKPEGKGNHTGMGRMAKMRTPLESFHHNNLWLSLSEVFLFRVGLTYERLLGKKGKFSLRIPLSVSCKNKEAIFSQNGYYYAQDLAQSSSDQNYYMNGNYYTLSIPNVFGNGNSPLTNIGKLSTMPTFLNFGYSAYAGLGFRHYVGGQRRKNFFVGLELQGGAFQYQIQYAYMYDYINSYAPYYAPQPQKKTAAMVASFLEIGTRMNSPSNRLSFTLSLGIGKRYYIGAPNIKSDNSSSSSRFGNGGMMKQMAFNPQLQLSYNFGKKK